MTNHFHNSLHLPSVEKEESKAKSQDLMIYEWLKERAGQRFTAREIHSHFPHMELTSCRRCLTNMSNPDLVKFDVRLIHHTDDLKMESKGHPNTTYSYPAGQQTLNIC